MLQRKKFIASLWSVSARWGLLIGFLIVVVGAGLLARIYRLPGPSFTGPEEARQLAAELHVKFSLAADASNRAVMADTDEASLRFAQEAEQALQAMQAPMDKLATQLGSAEEVRSLEEFARRFGEFRDLDRSVLALAIENTNNKAQRLAFGPAREAADALQAALDGVARAAPAKTSCQVGALVASVVIAVRELQVLQPPHIAEADDGRMTQMEAKMAARAASASGSLRALVALVDPSSRAALATARAALERFEATNAQIIALSRRNTNVRSLALSLGRLRSLTSACDASLSALQASLTQRASRATR